MHQKRRMKKSVSARQIVALNLRIGSNTRFNSDTRMCMINGGASSLQRFKAVTDFGLLEASRDTRGANCEWC
jgi:hypothetical protein